MAHRLAVGQEADYPMEALTALHLNVLREALLKLEATGHEGFEGLIASILSAICGVNFRLASSGSQRGRDGDSDLNGEAINFEAKRYDEKIPFEKVVAKLCDLMIDDKGQLDAWILGATTEVSAQHAERLRAMAAKSGIALVILDWSTAGLPSLSLALAMADRAAETFLTARLGDPQVTSNIRSALDHIRALQNFEPLAKNLEIALRDRSIGLGLAKLENRRRWESIFKSKILAREHFGQPLAPGDASSVPHQRREGLLSQLNQAFSGDSGTPLFAVVGPEGVGKSWIVADCWLGSSDPPLLWGITADHFQRALASVGGDINRVLVNLAIQQDCSEVSESSVRRWQRRFQSWRSNQTSKSVRVVLWIDGLDQASNLDWARWIDALASRLAELGGRLVVTTRKAHYSQFASEICTSQCEIEVTEWTQEELKQILASKQLDTNTLSARVFLALRNPRILSIAIGLLNESEIRCLSELSVGRLLFEHVRRSHAAGISSLTSHEFSNLLRSLGDEVVERLKCATLDDLTVFDASINNRLAAVVSCRFFRVVDKIAGLYEIEDDGLLLALGLWLASEVNREVRNKRDPSLRLGAILDPVAALDMTASVVSAAVEVACLSNEYDTVVSAALLCHLASLQNITGESRDTIASLIEVSPQAFIGAVERTALSISHVPNNGWLTGIVIANRLRRNVRSLIAARIPCWLARYSLASEPIYPRLSKQADNEARREAAMSRTKEKLAGLTASEREFLDGSLREAASGDLDNLHRLAFLLLAGTPLVESAPALIAWAFSNSLAPNNHAPNKEFKELLRHNHVDWRETRERLRVLPDELLGKSRSIVGEWVRVKVLRGTGDPFDSAEADEIVTMLNKDRTLPPGWRPSWRLVEEYCNSDPCDPGSSTPTNLGLTEEKYSKLEASTLVSSYGPTENDHLFRMALPGLARFSPEVPVHVIRALALDVLDRKGHPRWLGIVAIQPHGVLLNRPVIEELVRAAQSAVAAPNEGNVEDVDWATAHYSMRAALPHLDPDVQMSAICGLYGTSLLILMLERLRAPSSSAIDRWLGVALKCGDKELLIRVLAVIKYTSPELSEIAATSIAPLMSSDDANVRTEALGVCACTKHPVLLRWHAHSAWRSDTVSSDRRSYEDWYGSNALIACATEGFIGVSDLIPRIGLDLYGVAASILGDEAARTLGDALTIALRRAASLESVGPPPVMVKQVGIEGSCKPTLFDLRSDESIEKDTLDLKSKLEAMDEWREQRNRLRNWYRRFAQQLSDENAELVLSTVGFSGVEAMVRARPSVIETWSELLGKASPASMVLLHAFSVEFASALVRVDPGRGIRFLDEATKDQGRIRHVLGLAEVPIESWAVWRNGRIEGVREICFARLDECKNDHEIAIEVLAALQNNCQHILEEYVNRSLASQHPVRIARSLMVCGFSDSMPQFDEIIDDRRGIGGFIGTAADAAAYASDRNRWARNWFEKMAGAESPQDLWRCSVLLSKIVDGRVDIWGSEQNRGTDLFQRFYSLLDEELKRRVKKWKDKRQRKLYGDEVPASVFLGRP